MKATRLITIILLILLFIFLSPSSAQNINVHEMIGEKISTVISKYGKPAHRDKSNPAMECIFYKSKSHQLVFVANKKGVFQAEGCKRFTNKRTAEKELRKIITACNRKGYSTDTVNVSEFNIHKKGVRFNVMLMENNFSKKYEVKIKANKYEG